jgi:hypothetical protein
LTDGGLDDAAGQPETGAHPQDGGGVGRNVGLIEGNFDHVSGFLVRPGGAGIRLRTATLDG